VSSDALAALTIFAFVASITPGPANFLLLASGVNFGFVRTLPQVFGIGAGFVSLLLGVGLGLGAVLSAFPALHAALKIAACVYLLWLAWRIAMSRSMSAGGASGPRPAKFAESAIFPWINPKAWVIALTAMAVYTDPKAPFVSVILITIAFGAINLPSIAAWAAFGSALRGFLADPRRLKWFNISMGVLLAATLWPMLA
jgi:threonine/homoserine/homoserine lactone efflux protein